MQLIYFVIHGLNVTFHTPILYFSVALLLFDPSGLSVNYLVSGSKGWMSSGRG